MECSRLRQIRAADVPDELLRREIDAQIGMTEQRIRDNNAECQHLKDKRSRLISAGRTLGESNQPISEIEQRIREEEA